MRGIHSRIDLFLLAVSLVFATGFSNLILSKVDRRIDLTSQIVRITSTLKVENEGNDAVSEVLITFLDHQAKNLAYLAAVTNDGKSKGKGSTVSFPVDIVYPKDMPPSLTFYSVSLPQRLSKGDSVTFDVKTFFTHSLLPFPEKITQADIQLVLFGESAYYLSPYPVKVQSLSVKLPDARIESYTKLEKTKIHGSEIKYGAYEDLPSFSYTPISIHFESNQPFAVVKELEREIEISHWGNVQVTEHYSLIHGGAESKGEFSRLDYQARPHVRGASAFQHLVAKLPPRAHSVYYRDAIGNISTSHLWGDSKKTELKIEPRYPMFGGWRTAFTIGYGVPLQDFLFQAEGKYFLNITFGCSMSEVVVDRLIVKVVLPEGSGDISMSAPFPVKQSSEIKFSHLDIVGRPVIVMEKTNVVPEHNQFFQIYYKFNTISMLMEPLMLIFGFFVLFISCIIYNHVDMSLSKSSAAYLAQLQWDEVQTAIQRVQSIIERCIGMHEKLDSSLRDLSRTGDVQSCKAARKAADALFKELSKELKSSLGLLQSSPQATHIWPKVEELVTKARDLQERLIAKHTTVVDCYEKKYGGREIESRVAAQQQKIAVLRQEVDDLLEFIDEI